MRRSFLDELSATALSLVEGEHQRFSAPIYWVCLANGDADFHDNVIFFGFEAKQTQPVLVAKVPRLHENSWMLQTEYDHLMMLWDCIGEEAGRFVPRPYALTTIQERSVLLISYVPGESMTRLWLQSFWKDKEQVSSLAREAARTLRDLNHLTKSPIGPEEALNRDLQIKINKFKEIFPVSSEEDRELSTLARRFEERVETASHKVLLQGDFWHGNMIRDKKRGTLMLVDWQFARWSVDASMDVYFFLLACALSATGANTVEERAKIAYQILSAWRADVIPEYLAAYGKPKDYVLLPQKQGMLMCCVEKAVRSALEFGYSHPDDLMWRHLFTHLQKWPVEE